MAERIGAGLEVALAVVALLGELGGGGDAATGFLDPRETVEGAGECLGELTTGANWKQLLY